MRHIIWLAIVLVVLYFVLRLAAGMVGIGLHLLWIAAIIVFVIWLIGQIRGRGPRVP